MNQLVKEITKGLLEEKQKSIAVFGGGFKPPTKGHLEVVKQALSENPEVDEFIILVGKGERGGITQEDSVKVWNIYKRYLPFKVNIVASTKPPIQAIYNIAKENPEAEVLWVIGARDGNEDDFTDIATRTKSMSKYPNLELRTIVTKGGISGTAARNALQVSKDKFENFIPDFLTPEEKNNIYIMLTNEMSEAIVGKKIQCDNCDWNWNIKDGGDDLYTCHKCWHDNTPKKQLNEEASFAQHIDYQKKIAELTQHMVRKGMNVTPLPKVSYVHGDDENAKDFFGKTAYYDPNAMEIVLYTEGRHPKDIVRSFSHEMIHHIQNLEGRLGNVITTNTTEDEHLNNLEAEANLKGTMTFRNWTDSAKKNESDPFGLNAYARELMKEEEQNYKIYVDMDGVIADFDARFRDLSGMAPRDFEAKYGKKAFWDLIDEENKVKFWVGIPPMPGASELISFVAKHDYEMLTAPSIKKQSRLGKNLWIRNHTGDIFPSKPRVNFKAAKEKHLIKPQLTSFDILIDDKASTIDSWNAAGGTGILYQSASQVISKLKKLGL